MLKNSSLMVTYIYVRVSTKEQAAKATHLSLKQRLA